MKERLSQDNTSATFEELVIEHSLIQKQALRSDCKCIQRKKEEEAERLFKLKVSR